MIRAALLAALFSFVAIGAEAQESSPLDRRVTLHVRDIALRDALDRVALQAGVRLSYSGDNLPLDRRVSVSRDSALLSDVLMDLVRPYAVRALAVADDHVALAPLRTASADSASRSIQVLERVVVTGSVIAASERPLPVAIDVVSGREMETRDESSLAKVLSGSVPGVWLWEQTPTMMLARYGSIRGASSFGMTFPKMYIDGIEVANPLLLTQISPELVERIEVIRGPQGAALYGSDAISGVINIVSRHEGTAPDGSHAQLRSTVGTSSTHYGSGNAAMQDHALTLRTGSNLRSGGITIGAATAGQYIPNAHSREFRTLGDARLVGTRLSFIGTGRFVAKSAGVPVNPLLAGVTGGEIESDDDPQQLRMYAAGGTVSFAPNARWTYTATGGLDGYSLSNVSTEHTPVPSVADTALRAASGSALRGILRMNAVTHVGSADQVGANITLGAEQSTLWDRTLREFDDDSGDDDEFVRGQSSNTGVLAQTTVTVRNTAFLTAGLRHERVDQPRGATQRAFLPMAGLSVVRDYEKFSVKWRAAYGKGIRAPRSSMHLATREPRRTIANDGLMPEEQAGIETGLDLRVGGSLGVHLTWFDQTVSGLIQTVTVDNPSQGTSGPSGSSWYQFQNVGEIGNRGVESQAVFAAGSLRLSGAATFVDSRVLRVHDEYTGDLRAGDRMLAVPARTVSVSAGWSRPTYHLSATVSRASDWVNYDRLRIAQALVAESIDADDLTGGQLRSFWKSYPGTTRLRTSASREVWRGLTMHITGENLLGYQLGEPDTITIVPGRTLSFGVRARF
jgi:outer membrane receptor protein involved in Fe transport